MQGALKLGGARYTWGTPFESWIGYHKRERRDSNLDVITLQDVNRDIQRLSLAALLPAKRLRPSS